jgi:hypothetical protein
VSTKKKEKEKKILNFKILKIIIMKIPHPKSEYSRPFNPEYSKKDSPLFFSTLKRKIVLKSNFVVKNFQHL